MPKYNILVYPREKIREVHDSVDAEFEKLRKEDKHPWMYQRLLQTELRKRRIPYVYLRGVDAADYDEARRVAEGTFRDVVGSGVETVVYTTLCVDEVVIDPPGEGQSLSGVMVLVAGLITAAIPVFWSFLARR
jgi:hypothetical protein